MRPQLGTLYLSLDLIFGFTTRLRWLLPLWTWLGLVVFRIQHIQRIQIGFKTHSHLEIHHRVLGSSLPIQILEVGIHFILDLFYMRSVIFNNWLILMGVLDKSKSSQWWGIIRQQSPLLFNHFEWVLLEVPLLLFLFFLELFIFWTTTLSIGIHILFQIE